ncbi:hypothetical protein Tco_0799060 [Tanacetum coccineum]
MKEGYRGERLSQCTKTYLRHKKEARGLVQEARDLSIIQRSLANKLYLKKKLYTFYMPAGRKISEHIDEFNKIILDLANIEMEELMRRDSRQVKGESQDWKSPGGNSSELTLLPIDDHVLLGDNRECKIRGIGKVKVQLKDGSSFVLHNVRYIPELKRNLISLGTLEKEGYTVKMQFGQKSKVINGSRVVLSGTRRTNCVYSLDGHAVAGELNASVDEKDSLAQVWHKILGHISEAGLQVRRVWVYIPSFQKHHNPFGKFKESACARDPTYLVKESTGTDVKKLRIGDNDLLSPITGEFEHAMALRWDC